MCMVSTLTSQSSRVNLQFDGGNHRCEWRDSKDDGIEIRRSRQTDSMDGEDISNGREVLDRYHHSHDGDYGKGRSRYDGMGRTPGMFCSHGCMFFFLQCLFFFPTG